MKTLAKEFTKNNFHHRQVHREGNLAVYERYWIPSVGEHKHYEVVKIKKSKGFTWPNGTVFPPQEVYPSSSAWGNDGFTCLTKQDAYNRLERMKEEIKPSKPTPHHANLLTHLKT